MRYEGKEVRGHTAFMNLRSARKCRTCKRGYFRKAGSVTVHHSHAGYRVSADLPAKRCAACGHIAIDLRQEDMVHAQAIGELTARMVRTQELLAGIHGLLDLRNVDMAVLVRMPVDAYRAVRAGNASLNPLQWQLIEAKVRSRIKHICDQLGAIPIRVTEPSRAKQVPA